MGRSSSAAAKRNLAIFHGINIGVFILGVLLDFISIFLSDVAPIFLLFIFWTVLTWLFVVVLQTLACMAIFPLKNATRSEYVKEIDLCLVYSVLCVLIITALKGIIYISLARHYEFADPFGLLMTLDHTGLPSSYILTFFPTYTCSAVFQLLCIFALMRALAVYWIPLSVRQTTD